MTIKYVWYNIKARKVRIWAYRTKDFSIIENLKIEYYLCSSGTLPTKKIDNLLKRGKVEWLQKKHKQRRAPVAESVDALDLKSNWAYNPVPVQVWPGAIFKRLADSGSFLLSSRLSFQFSFGFQPTHTSSQRSFLAYSFCKG